MTPEMLVVLMTLDHQGGYALEEVDVSDEPLASSPTKAMVTKKTEEVLMA